MPRDRNYIWPTKDLHDRCLQVCNENKAELTEKELLALNRVADSWAATVQAHRDDVAEAHRILEKFDL